MRSRSVASWSFGGFLALTFLVILWGCGDDQKVEQLPPQQIVQKAAVAIETPQSFHFTVVTDKMHKLPGLWLTSAEGDAVKPDKLVADVGARYNNYSFKSKVVVSGSAQYWTDPLSGKWEVMPDYFNMTQLFDPAKGVVAILNGLKNLANDGVEQVNGVTAYRLKGAVPATSLRALSQEVNVTGDVSSTLWIGAKDFLVRQVRLDGALMQGEPGDISRTVTVTDFDKPVKVETPVIK